MRLSGLAKVSALVGSLLLASCIDGTVSGPTGPQDPQAPTPQTPTSPTTPQSPDPTNPTNPNPVTPDPVTPSPNPTTPNPTTPAADFAVTAAVDSATSNLGEKRIVTLTVTPSGGFGGTVALQAMALPAGFSASFNPPSLTVGANPVTAMATIQVPTNARVGVTELSFGASDGTSVKTAKVSVDIKGELVIHIARGVAITNNLQAFGVNPMDVPLLAAGTKVTWINDDIIDHRIHSGVTAFPHEPSNLVPGASYSVVVKQAGTFGYNCHIHSGMKGTLKVAVPPATP